MLMCDLSLFLPGNVQFILVFAYFVVLALQHRHHGHSDVVTWILYLIIVCSIEGEPSEPSPAYRGHSWIR